jgi:type II secretion system protein C
MLRSVRLERAVAAVMEGARRHSATFVSVVLAAGLVVEVRDTARAVAVSPQAPMYSSAVVPAAQRQAAGQLATGLFGTAVDASPPQAAADASLDGVSLTGVIALADPSDGFAVMAAGDSSSRMLRYGDFVVAGARLVAVHVDYVLVEFGARREALYLPRSVSAALSLAANATNDAAAAPTVSASRIAVSAPVFDADHERIQGFRIGPSRDPRPFEALGLVEGDVITRIRGRSAESEDQIGELFRALSAGHAVSVTIRRGSETFELDMAGTVLAAIS